ncbi:hypothetical protein CH373_12670 [Leptospira perolatii]|uniref:ArsR family transcriptional regulator n=2 Tax=Leptospira perolatii TaxID=2023191 RepID=A0A2M9ZLE0_9LEPT|nr:hypothetical protein CH360_06300 [Leptospira perolatii]PJZ72902.1 hypothetical protein CH373_12670 [Leptospira perolatii]
MKGREYKSLVFKELSGIGKALGDPKRIEILDLISQASKSVESIAQDSGASVATASHHLQILKEVHLARNQKLGKYVYYEASEAGVRLLDCLGQIGESLSAEIALATRTFFEEIDSLEAFDYESLQKEVRGRKLMLIDVRPLHEYEVGHFPGAISIPLKELEKNLEKLPRSKHVVAYCRGKYCVLSKEAVQILSKHGFKAKRLEKGILEFKAGGHKLEIGGK